jgi:hypothetical protein
MKEELAQRLLALVMEWDENRLAQELPRLDRMARFKYDEYQQFGPGQKFLEALCLWLKQFATKAERETAYAFVRDRVVFISAADMRHLVESSFPDVIRPSLIADAASSIGIAPHCITKVVRHPDYHRSLRQTLFLGLSDGSRMDIFRRAAALDNEQVWQAYEIGKPKSAGMLKDLQSSLVDENAQFARIVLIDDFSASGISYIRKEGDQWKGKLIKALKQFRPGEDASCLIKYSTIKMQIVLYVATKAAVDYIGSKLAVYCEEQSIPVPSITAVYELAPDMTLAAPRDKEFLALVDSNSYYRTRPLDEHEAKGGTSTIKRGFAACGLPLVLAHNCPNNSIYLLWADPLEVDSARGLFPRIVRHREVV